MIDRSWITPKERKAATAALDAADAVRNSGGLGENVYAARVQAANAAMAQADKVAFTFRDHVISSSLYSVVESAKMERKVQLARESAGSVDARRLKLATALDALGLDTERALRQTLGIRTSGSE